MSSQPANTTTGRGLIYRGVVAPLLPAGWAASDASIWLHCAPIGSHLPPAGWKLHLSIVPKRASELLRITVPILVEHDCVFKCALDEAVLRRINGKNWKRGGSGKFITAYPTRHEQLLSLAAALDAVTRHLEGPYILSDRRYGASRVLSYRYGGYQRLRESNAEGEIFAVIPAPDGSRYRDTRVPYYLRPPWATDPFGAPDPQVDEPVLRQGRYRVVAALAHKNSGGVYLADDRDTGASVVVKEARKHVWVSEPDCDAQTLLAKEARLLRALHGIAVAPTCIDHFEEWEHRFLVEERLVGLTMYRHAAKHATVLIGGLSRETYFARFENMRSTFLQLSGLLRQLHQRGIVFGDLSPNNVMILADGTVRLVDFEAAYEIGVDTPVHLRTPGFSPPGPFEASIKTDLYAFGALMLSWFIPNLAVAVCDASYPARALDRLEAMAPVPEELMALIRGLLGSADARPDLMVVEATLRSLQVPERPLRHSGPVPSASETQRRLVSFVTSSLDLANADRLVPCDARGLVTHPLSLGYGASGVIGVLHSVSPSLVTDDVRGWVRHSLQDLSANNCGPGYLCGMAGIAVGLLTAGMTKEARALLELAVLHPRTAERAGFLHGLSGLGIAQVFFYQQLRDPSYLHQAEQTAERIRGRAIEHEHGLHWPEEDGVPLGLGHGASGVSLFLLYLYAATGSESTLRAGQRALGFDLRAMESTASEHTAWRAKWHGPPVFYPGFEKGSAGIGSVVARYYALDRRDEYLNVLKAIVETRVQFTVLGGLLNGLVGRVRFLMDAQSWCPDLRVDDQLVDLQRTLALFFVERKVGLGMVGSELTSPACDYATGSAGAIECLARLQGGPTLFVPDELLARCVQQPGIDERVATA